MKNKNKKVKPDNTLETIKDHNLITILNSDISIAKLANLEIAIVIYRRTRGMFEQIVYQHDITFYDLSSTRRLLEHIIDDLNDPISRILELVMVVSESLSQEGIAYTQNKVKKLETDTKLQLKQTYGHSYFCIENGIVRVDMNLAELEDKYKQATSSQDLSSQNFTVARLSP